MIAKFFFQTKKRNQLLKNMMNGILCFIFNVTHEGSATGMRPNSPGRREHWAEKRPSDLGGECQVGVSGFPPSHHKHLFPFSHACPSYLSVICCVFSTCYWWGCQLVQCGAFKPLSCGFPNFWLYSTVGSCMVEGNSQLLMCKQTLGLLALFLLYCCLVTKWFGRAKGQRVQVLCFASQPQGSSLLLSFSLPATYWN